MTIECDCLARMALRSTTMTGCDLVQMAQRQMMMRYDSFAQMMTVDGDCPRVFCSVGSTVIEGGVFTSCFVGAMTNGVWVLSSNSACRLGVNSTAS